MEIKTKKIGKHTLVRLNGRLDITQADEVESQMANDVQSGEGDIVINLESISYISSSGIRIFVGMVRELEKQKRKLKLCAITPPVKKVFDVVELLDLFDVYETEGEAVASLSK
ncbi:MAG: STAS domain-containing protein [Leptospiraceae bacterium]|nr:STAS domain-containing protein [Leptospiraceae bacterium]MCK6382279.1 STAS domain-containing protein [Leptospiraceae bacterium]NUM41721.1 STAS domain-containing protein [Leptospiraceae bacterium]